MYQNSTRKSAGDKMGVLQNGCKVSRLRSPVTMHEAFTASAISRNLSSCGSRQALMESCGLISLQIDRYCSTESKRASKETYLLAKVFKRCVKFRRFRLRVGKTLTQLLCCWPCITNGNVLRPVDHLVLGQKLTKQVNHLTFQFLRRAVPLTCRGSVYLQYNSSRYTQIYIKYSDYTQADKNSRGVGAPIVCFLPLFI